MIRRFILLVFVVVMAFHSSAVWAMDDVRAVTLTWTDNPKTSQTVTWQTAEPEKWNRLMYRQEGSEWLEDRLYTAQTSLFASETRDNYIQRVRLKGLKPGTRYEYRIGDGVVWQKEGSFVTEGDAPSFTFLLFSDSQSYDYRVWQKTFETAYTANRDASFYAVVGDLVDNGQQQSEWDAWFDAVANFSHSLPLAPVVGNHETYTPERKFSLPRYFIAQFAVPQNGPEQLRGQAYSFDYGSVHFAILDTQFGEERGFIPDSLERQQKWLAEDLAQTNQPWKVVLMHRPVYHNRMDEEGLGATGKFVPIFDAYDVDVVFSGHDHVVARTEKLKGGVASDKGTVYAPIGRSGTKTYDTVGRKNWNVSFFNPQVMPVYYVVKVEQCQLLVQIFQQDGVLRDEWRLVK